MKRALFPFLMLSHIAYAETESFQQEEKEIPLILDKPMDEMVVADQSEQLTAPEPSSLQAQEIEEESNQMALADQPEEVVLAEPQSLSQEMQQEQESVIAIESLQKVEEEKKDASDSLAIELLLMKKILGELKQEVVAVAQQQPSQNKMNQEQPAMPKKGCYNKVQTDTQLFGTGAFLWWSAHEDGLAYASTGFNSNPTSGNAPSQTSVPQGNIKNFGGEYHPGFKVGLGYGPNSRWDLYVNWTRLRQHPAHQVKASSENGSPLYDEWGDQAVVSGYPLLSARADWKLNFNTIDLEAGRLFMPSKCISIRPFAGLVGVIILQNYNVTEIINDSAPSNGRIANPTVSIRNYNNYRGIGLRGGLGSGFHFFSDWEVFGNFAASLISGKFKVLNYQTTNDNTFPHPYMNVVDRFWSVKTEFEAALGLRWGRNFSGDRCHIQFDVSWEERWLPGQNQMRRYLTPTIFNGMGLTVDMPQSINEKGDLGLYGLTFGARLDF